MIPAEYIHHILHMPWENVKSSIIVMRNVDD